jgi:hypothetical protein
MLPHAPLQTNSFTFSLFRQDDPLIRSRLHPLLVAQGGDVDATNDSVAVSKNESGLITARRRSATSSTNSVTAAWAPAPHGGRVRHLGKGFLRVPQRGRVATLRFVKNGEVGRPPQNSQTIKRQGRAAFGGSIVEEAVASDDVPLCFPQLVDAHDVELVLAHGADVLTSAHGREARPVAVATPAGTLK